MSSSKPRTHSPAPYDTMYPPTPPLSDYGDAHQEHIPARGFRLADGLGNEIPPSTLPQRPVSLDGQKQTRLLPEKSLVPEGFRTRPPADVPLEQRNARDQGWESGEFFKTDPSSQGTRKAARSFVRPFQRSSSMMQSQAFWLALYFGFNLGLTLYNKSVLVQFPFPYTLTAVHTLCGSIGCWVLHERGYYTRARLTVRENVTLASFSVLYTVNIAVSNLSLQLVTVPFHQVVRASTPLFTIIIARIVLHSQFSSAKLYSLLPVIAGVGFATYGDYYFTLWGLFLTLLGTVLAALKTVLTNYLQSGAGGRYKLHPLDLLLRMSPLAFVQCVVYGWWSGELEKVRQYGAFDMNRKKALALLLNGVIAFSLNVVSFTANKKTGPLTMTVAANVKQVLTIVLAVIIFNLKISPTNAFGIVLTLVGGAGYAAIEYRDKRRKLKTGSSPSLPAPHRL